MKSKPVLRQWLDQVSCSPFASDEKHLDLSTRLLSFWDQQTHNHKKDEEPQTQDEDGEEYEDEDDQSDVEEYSDSEEESEEAEGDIPLILNIEDKKNEAPIAQPNKDKNANAKSDRPQKTSTQIQKHSPDGASNADGASAPPGSWRAALRRRLRDYSPAEPDPLLAKAELEAPWELTLLAKHYHPSVAKWAKSLLEGDELVYAGDPIRDFQIIPFLDRFSFKKPKKGKEEASSIGESKTGSVMEPLYGRFFLPHEILFFSNLDGAHASCSTVCGQSSSRKHSQLLKAKRSAT